MPLASQAESRLWGSSTLKLPLPCLVRTPCYDILCWHSCITSVRSMLSELYLPATIVHMGLPFCSPQATLGISCAGLGEAKALMGNKREASPLLQRAYNLLLKWLGASHPYTARARKALQ